MWREAGRDAGRVVFVGKGGRVGVRRGGGVPPPVPGDVAQMILVWYFATAVPYC